MSVVPPPNPNVDRFNNTYWTSVDAGSLSIADLETYFLTFPSAQGTENLLATNTLGQANFYADIAMIGTGNSITFPDGSVQTFAYTGGAIAGDAVLADDQTFTGYNQFNNNSGINLINTTSTNSVAIGADSTTNGLLNISGNLKVGNGSLIATNIYSAAGSTSNSINMLSTLSGNTSTKTGLGVYYNANGNGEVDLVGMGNASGGGFNFYQSNASSLTNQMKIASNGVSLVNGSNSILMYADGTNNNQLDISGNATISSVQSYGTTYPDQNLATIKYVNESVSSGGASLTADQTFTGANTFNNSGGLTIGSGVSGNSNKITLINYPSINNLLYSTGGLNFNSGTFSGNILSTAGSITATLGDIVASTGNITCSNGTMTCKRGVFVGTAQTYPDTTNTGDFATIGYVNAILAGGTSITPQIFTGYNKFNNKLELGSLLQIDNTTANAPYYISNVSSGSSVILQQIAPYSSGGTTLLWQINNNTANVPKFAIVDAGTIQYDTSGNQWQSNPSPVDAGYPVQINGYNMNYISPYSTTIGSQYNWYGYVNGGTIKQFFRVNGGGGAQAVNPNADAPTTIGVGGSTIICDGAGSLSLTAYNASTTDAETRMTLSTGSFVLDDLNNGLQITIGQGGLSTDNPNGITLGSTLNLNSNDITNVDTITTTGAITTGGLLSANLGIDIPINYNLDTPEVFINNSEYTPSSTTISTDENGLTINNELSLINYGGTNKIRMYSSGDFNNQLDLIGGLNTQSIKLNTNSGITFNDSSIQTTAYTGQIPSGAASLTAGTTTEPQIFTGFNVISNDDGFILEHPTSTNTIQIVADGANAKQVDFFGSIGVGNATNSYLTMIESDAINGNQLNIDGSLSIGNASNSNSVILSTSTANNQLDVAGAVSLTNNLIMNDTDITEIRSESFFDGISLTDAGTNSITSVPLSNTIRLNSLNGVYVNTTSLDNGDGTIYGTASKASTIAITDSSLLTETYYPTFVSNSGTGVTLRNDSDLTYNPSTNTLSAGTFNGVVTNATNATNATKIDVQTDTSNFNIPLIFTDTSSVGNVALKQNSSLTCNPFLGTITASAFNGNATSSTTATNANNVLITSDGATATACNIPYVKTTATGNKPLFIDDTAPTFTYTPNTGQLSCSSTRTNTLLSGTSTDLTITNTTLANKIVFNTSSSPTVQCCQMEGTGLTMSAGKTISSASSAGAELAFSVPNATGNLTFTGTNIQSATSGGNSGQHLRIKLNGVFYKIALQVD